MNNVSRKLCLGLVAVVVAVLFFSTIAIALDTAIIEDGYSPKLNGVQGAITKIEGNKITLRDEAGKLHTIGVRPESADDKHKLRGFQIGDKVKIEEGRIRRISTIPGPLPRPK